MSQNEASGIHQRSSYKKNGTYKPMLKSSAILGTGIRGRLQKKFGFFNLLCYYLMLCLFAFTVLLNWIHSPDTEEDTGRIIVDQTQVRFPTGTKAPNTNRFGSIPKDILEKRYDINPLGEDCRKTRKNEFLTIVVLSPAANVAERRIMSLYIDSISGLPADISIVFAVYEDNEFHEKDNYDIFLNVEATQCGRQRKIKCLWQAWEHVQKKKCSEFILFVTDRVFINVESLISYLLSISSEYESLILPPPTEDSEPMFLISGAFAASIYKNSIWFEHDFHWSEIFPAWELTYGCGSKSTKCEAIREPRFCTGGSQVDDMRFCDPLIPEGYFLRGNTFPDEFLILGQILEISLRKSFLSNVMFPEDSRISQIETLVTIGITQSKNLGKFKRSGLFCLIRLLRSVFPRVKINFASSATNSDLSFQTSLSKDFHQITYFKESDSADEVQDAIIKRSTTPFVLLIEDNTVFLTPIGLTKMLDRMLKTDSIGMIKGDVLNLGQDFQITQSQAQNKPLFFSAMQEGTCVQKESASTSTNFILVRKQVFNTPELKGKSMFLRPKPLFQRLKDNGKTVESCSNAIAVVR